jgi:hypothetical protein
MNEMIEEQLFKDHVINHSVRKWPGTCKWCQADVEKRKRNK